MEKLRSLMDFCTKHKKALGYSIVSLLTVASEQIFSSVAFQCPCNSWNTMYGCAFLIVPALILFLLGCMANTRSWILLTGSCSLKKQSSCGFWEKFYYYLKVLVPVTAITSVAPLTWIAVALLSTRFYECAASRSSYIRRRVCKDMGKECWQVLEKIPCDKSAVSQLNKTSLSEVDLLSFQAHSQMFGWLLIVIIIAVALISTCISRCFSPIRHFQLTFSKIYAEKEQEQFEVKAQEHAAKLAERNISCFFEATNPTAFQTPSNEAWQNISFPHTFSEKEQYYSTIHKYVDANRDTRSMLSDRGQTPSHLEIVNEGREMKACF
ncbi:CAHM6 protein, partial [Alectura lathami]|nr:CAHM6 protein [Alectura lathami]